MADVVYSLRIVVIEVSWQLAIGISYGLESFGLDFVVRRLRAVRTDLYISG